MEENGPGPGLTEAEIEALAERLKSGQYLPDYLRDRLFQVQREAELSYGGRTPRSRVLSETMAVPLQTVKRFGEPENGWTNKLIFGDNLQALKELLEMKARGELVNADGSHGVRLCYIDPPFATGEEWKTRAGEVAYLDRVKGTEFIEWLRRRLVLISELLADDGALIVHLDQRYVHYIKVVLDELLPGNFRNEIIVPRGVKGVQSQFERIYALAQGHYSLLLYSKSVSTRYPKLLDQGRKPARWDTFWLGTDRPTMRYRLFGIKPEKGQWRWGEEKAKKAIENYEAYLAEAPDVPIEEYAALLEERTGEKPDFLRQGDKGPQWYRYEKATRLASDVWDVKTKGQVTGYPTEKHEDLIARLVEWLTRPGDLVLDAFLGSGTTVAVAQRLSRRWVGVDCGKYAIYTTQGRLLGEAGQGGAEPKLATAASFDVCAAGLYDNDLLEQLDPDDYQAFALELFGCRADSQVIGGIEMAGTRSGDPVHVFPYTETDGDMGREYIDSLEARLRGLHSGACYVIAPRSRCDPGLFEDVIDVREIKFFILRIPYSAIEALYQRRFEKLLQPTEAAAVNDPIDAFGFDFVRVPEVKASFKKTGGSFAGEIKNFYRGNLDPDDRAAVEDAGRGDLAMVMLDRDWDGEVFRITDYWFGETLEQSGWRFSVPLAECGKRALVIYIDTHGNERREAIDVAAPRKKPPPKKKPKPKSGAKTG